MKNTEFLEKVNKNSKNKELQYVEYKNKKIAISLQYVENKRELCLEAVRQKGHTLEFVDNSIFSD